MTLKLNGSSSGSVSIDSPASTTGGADVTLTLPVNDGDAGQVLQTDGSGNLSWVAPGGITVCDHWQLTANTTAGTNGVIADSSGAGGTWVKYASSSTSVTSVTSGAGGGKFSFPTTGHYLITGNFSTYHNTNDNDCGMFASITTDNFGSTTTLGYIRQVFNQTVTGAANAYQAGSSSFLFDVTDISNCKFNWNTASMATNNYVFGATGGAGALSTNCIIMRIGDT